MTHLAYISSDGRRPDNLASSLQQTTPAEPVVGTPQYDYALTEEEGRFDMLRSILVPLDGSEFAENAIPLALNIATRARRTSNCCESMNSTRCMIPHTCWSPYESGRGRSSIGPKSRRIWT